MTAVFISAVIVLMTVVNAEKFNSLVYASEENTSLTETGKKVDDIEENTEKKKEVKDTGADKSSEFSANEAADDNGIVPTNNGNPDQFTLLIESRVNQESEPVSRPPKEVSDHITNIEITKSEEGHEHDQLKDGDGIRIKVNFDDSKGSFVANDHIRFKWNSDEKDENYAALYGFQDSILVSVLDKDTNQNIEVGTFNLDLDHALFVFNKNIEGLKNVKGEFEFGAVAHNMGNKNSNPVTIYSGDSGEVPLTTVKVKGNVPASSSSSTPQHKVWESEKVGNQYDDGSIRYGIYLNKDFTYLDGDIIVDDLAGDGWIFDTSWQKSNMPRIMIDPYGQNKNIDFFKNEKTGKARYTIDFTDNKLHIVFNKDDFSNHEILIDYKIKPIKELRKYVNNADITYQIKDQDKPKTERDTKVVDNNRYMRANIYGVKDHELKIIKKDEQTGEFLSDVAFEITDPNGNVFCTLPTDKDGITFVKHTIPGFYHIKEVKAKDGYVLDDRDWIAEVTSNGKGQAVIIYNHRIPWTPLTPAKKVIPWTLLTPAQKVIPWTPLVPAEKVKTSPDSTTTPESGVLVVTDDNDESSSQTSEEDNTSTDNQNSASFEESEAKSDENTQYNDASDSIESFEKSKAKGHEKTQAKKTKHRQFVNDGKRIKVVHAVDESKVINHNTKVNVESDEGETPELPETGNSSSVLTSILGLLSVVFATVLFIFYKKA